MKKSILLLTLIASISSFAADCTINVSRGANFPDVIEDYVQLNELVSAQEDRLAKKGYTLTDSTNADIIAKSSLVVYQSNEGAAVTQADFYTIKDGKIDIDVYSRQGLFGTEAKKLITKSLKKMIKKLPECEK